MIPILTTGRLLLRPLELSDAAAIQAVFPQWEIVRFLSKAVPWPYPADGAETYLRDVALPAMARGTEWHWTLRPRDASATLIGLISLMDRPDENRSFWLDPVWQGRGLMTEAVEAVTDFWFESLGREVLRAPKAAANQASRRLSERTGMRLVAMAEHAYVGGPMPEELWEVTRDE